MTDHQFLQWIHDRLVNVHNEHEMYDYMHRLRRIIGRMKREEKREEDSFADHWCAEVEDERYW